ncbi:MAG TPA: histidine phosphatase family protein [Trebonia sp.]|nr:histidine phosphatase family protein [Trebonia sp.]
MNQLSDLDQLGNRYFGMRHGESKANVAGLIVSRIETDRSGDYGLSDRGRLQAAEAARCCDLGAQTVIRSSDFARAWQTAQIVRERLGAAEVVAAAELRERNFGELDGSPATGYTRVWAADRADEGADDGADAGVASAARGPVPDGVEPVTAVLDRTVALITELERLHTGRDILLVSHGDTLAILAAGFLGVAPSQHRSVPAFGTAEIRPLRPRDDGTRP